MSKLFSSKKIAVLAVACALVVSLVAPAIVNAAQYVSVVGSTTVYPIAVGAQASDLTQWGSDFDITGGGSGNGRATLEADGCDVGMSSSKANASLQAIFDEWVVGVDMINVVVSTSWYGTLDTADDGSANDSVNVSSSQLELLYESGSDVVNWTWEDLLGVSDPALDVPVVPAARIVGSGTRSVFMDKLDIDDGLEQTTMPVVLSNYGVDRQGGNSEMRDLVIADNPSSGHIVGYIGLGYAITEPGLSGVKSLKVDGVAATAANLDTYLLARQIYYYTREKEDDSTYNMRAMDFVEYTLSPAGQAVVDDEGFIALSDAGADAINPPAWWDIVVDSNKRMDVADFSLFGSSWNDTGSPGFSRCDLNNNGRVDVPDFSKLGSIWGKNYQYRGYNSTPQPE